MRAEGRKQTPTLNWAQRVLEERGQLDAETMGALYHERLGYHPSEERCEWCHRNGTDVLAGLLRRRRATAIALVVAALPPPEERQ